jgi:hypothetical protein
MPLTVPSADAQRGPSWTTTTMLGARMRLFGSASIPVSAAWPVANTAILVPFTVTTPVTFAEIFFQAGTSPGTANFDLGVYRDDFTRIASLGATASVNTTDAILPVGGGAFAAPVTLGRGRYYIAMSAAAISITVRSNTPGNSLTRAFGCISMATAHPLPATVTPAQASTVIPVIGLTTITNIL